LPIGGKQKSLNFIEIQGFA